MRNPPKPTYRHEVEQFGINRIKCRCGWFYEQPVAGVSMPMLYDQLLDTYNSHLISMSERGRL